MSNEIAVIPEVAVNALSWAVKTKSGDVLIKQAHCATSQAFAPKAARLAAGQEKDLAQLISGCYRPVLSSVSAKLTGKDIKSLFNMGVSVSQSAPSKADMVPFATAIIQLWAGAKGEKAAIASMFQNYVNNVTGSIPAPSVPAVTAPAPF